MTKTEQNTETCITKHTTYKHTKKITNFNAHCIFHSCTMHLDIIKVFYLPTDAQENCFKRNVKIYIKTALTCFGAITIIRERIIRACCSHTTELTTPMYFN